MPLSPPPRCHGTTLCVLRRSRRIDRSASPLGLTGASFYANQAAIAALIRETVPLPKPMALATFLMPSPRTSRARMAASTLARPTSEAAAPQPVNAHCKVLLEFDVFVQCAALDEVHAERVIQEAFRGERLPLADFRTIFEREETEAFMRRQKLVVYLPA
jgi:hypothetical protein